MGRQGRGEGLQEILTGSESGSAAAHVKRLEVSVLLSLGWEPGNSGCQVALITRSLWGYPQDQDRKREAGQEQQNDYSEHAPGSR